jgi:hypothetical protein
MGYRKIPNLYKDIRILDFKECYALEKIHGTSAHVRYKDDRLHFFSGGEILERFVSIFDQDALLEAFRAKGIPEITVYGESCGGKMQGMRETYGEDVRFMAFEVKIGDAWLNVENAAGCVRDLGLEFVAYERGPATVEWLNEQRDKPSQLALDLGLGEKMREGIVIRPVMEYRDYRGNRIIIKHKRDEFKETRTKREVDPDKLKILEKARDVAEEWVVPMRLLHVLDKMPEKGELEHIPLVIKAMREDIKAESDGEVLWSKAVEKAIGSATAELYKKHISEI